MRRCRYKQYAVSLTTISCWFISNINVCLMTTLPVSDSAHTGNRMILQSCNSVLSSFLPCLPCVEALLLNLCSPMSLYYSIDQHTPHFSSEIPLVSSLQASTHQRPHCRSDPAHNPPPTPPPPPPSRSSPPLPPPSSPLPPLLFPLPLLMV